MASIDALGAITGNGRVGRIAAIGARAVGSVVALALPPRCPGCGVPVQHDHRFCAACWGRLRLLAPPWCAGCNLPFDYDRGAQARCAMCLADPPRHAGIRAAVAYGPIARQLALKLKYGRRIGIATTMAERIVPVMPAGLDLLVPVPLHRWRLWSRGYNQAGLIAAALHRLTGVPHDPLALVRHRATHVLRGLGTAGRRRAVAGAFAVPEPARVQGRAIGLVDDVHASGATAAACTRALRAAGAASVTILCWARVIDDGGDDADVPAD
ncbi:ComF family protein [Sphingomonas sp. A2-49]|uniref:ComF family protein n=1 Tax=Sphingomonas sp. A2-49 TaxID=1391375 RepID=UPI0021D197FE|nr:ComF family protein [Sphingomonas sp. A2-49]MCU6453524.1 ComF family protein [Sphingomonas sp. A2-49]